jgi:hypothetical protein
MGLVSEHQHLPRVVDLLVGTRQELLGLIRMTLKVKEQEITVLIKNSNRCLTPRNNNQGGMHIRTPMELAIKQLTMTKWLNL